MSRQPSSITLIPTKTQKDGNSPFSLVEERLKLCLKSHKEGENDRQGCPGALPCVRSSPSSLIVDDVSKPDSVPIVVTDVGDKLNQRHLTTGIWCLQEQKLG